MRGCWPWSHDPGPCPVDDTPHTACTSPGYVGDSTQAVAVTVSRPAALRTPALPPPAAAPLQDVAPVVAETFTTKNYSRAKQGPRLRGKGARSVPGY